MTAEIKMEDFSADSFGQFLAPKRKVADYERYGGDLGTAGQSQAREARDRSKMPFVT